MEKKIPKKYLNLLKKINNLKIDYAVIKLYPIQKVTDIDVIVSSNDVVRFRNFLKREGFIEYRSEKGFEKYKAVFIKYEDLSFYTVHLHRAIAWDGQKILPADKVLIGKKWNGEFFVPKNDADLSIKILHVMFENSYFTKQDFEYIRQKIDLKDLVDFSNDYVWQKKFIAVCKKIITSKYEEIKRINFRINQHKLIIFSKKFFTGMRDATYYYGNLGLRILNPSRKGIVISLMGNDGCGKTTVANQVIEIFREAGFKNAKIEHMGQKPFLPTTKIISFARKKTNNESKGALIFKNSEKRSILKEVVLIYIWFEYLVRYFIKLYVPLTRSTTIITDRYYYDEFIQNQYSKISFVAPLLLKLYPKPEYNIYLDCSYELTKKRKGEISPEEYIRRKNAKNYFTQIEFINLKNEMHPNETVKKIMNLAANKAIEKMSW